jgi:prepilin-type N-terminal cleavage/methylation domain-containing protein
MKTSKRSGFTIVELVVASVIMGISSVMIFGLYINCLKTYTYDTFRLQINRDVRRFTNELTDNATYANYFVILSDFAQRTVPLSDPLVLAAMGDGESGDCVLFVFRDDADDSKIGKIVGYYHDPDETNYGPVRKFVVNCPGGSAANLWELMPNVNTLHTNSAIVDGSTIGTTLGSKMFYNYFTRSVMVKGRIIYTSKSGLVQQAISTYNFTVSPRG